MTEPLESELHAYADNRLDAVRHAAVEAWLAANPAAAARVADWRRQKESLHHLFDPVLDEAVPERLLRGGRAGHQRLAAALAWLAIGATLGVGATWLGMSRLDPQAPRVANGPTDLPRFVRQASVAHAVFVPEVKHPVEVGSGEVQALNVWLSNRLGRKMRAPDLASRGFVLMGGRLLPGEPGKPAAQFMYEDRRGLRLTVYLRGMAQPTPETAFRFAEQGGVGTFYWVDHDWGYALSGDLARPQLMDLAREIYTQLSG